jgi:hypothetical protein
MTVITNAINNKIGGSNSGVTNTLTIDNASNTASSQAQCLLTVGGATAGDPFITHTVSGVTSWSTGIDNSVTGDPFVISASTALGTTNIMSAATTGEINYPLQPAFSAYLATTATNKTGNGATYTIGTDALTEIFDQGGDFNTNGTFTAPVTGKYALNALVTLTGATALAISLLAIITHNRTYLSNVGRGAGAITDFANSLSVLADMDAADTATYTIAGFGEAGATDDILGGASVSTGVSGNLVC